MSDVVLDILIWALQIFLILMFVRFVMSWVFSLSRYRATGAVAMLLEVVYSVTDPPLKLLGRFIPPLRVGNMSIDIGFIVLLIGIQALVAVLKGYR